MINLIWKELNTPSGQRGPLSAAYHRAVVGIAHAVLGACAAAFLGVWGIGAAVVIAGVYWAVKEKGDLGRGGSFWDGAEDTVMVMLGGWYGVWWWPALILGAAFYIMLVAAWRAVR